MRGRLLAVLAATATLLLAALSAGALAFAPVITVSPSSLPNATVGQPYSQAITATGGKDPYRFSIASGSLPPGFTLSSDGTLSGTSTATGYRDFTVGATDDDGVTGTQAYRLTVAPRAVPPNDNFAAATPITLDTPIRSDNFRATGQTGESNPTSGGLRAGCTGPVTPDSGCMTSVWYSFTPPAGGQYTVDLCDGSTNTDTLLGIYTGALGSLTTVGQDDDACSAAGGSRVTFNATAGTEYHLAVEGFGATQGYFGLRVYAGPAAAATLSPDTRVGASSGSFATPGFGFSSSTDATSFECALDFDAFAQCEPAVEYLGFAEGTSHDLQVRATDGSAVDTTPAAIRFTVDTTPPDTTIPAAPSGTRNTISKTSTEAGSRFVCTIDGSARFACTTASTASYATGSIPGLCNGSHTLTVAAVDPAGNEDPTPASLTFTKTGGPACTTASGATTTATATATGADVGLTVNGGGSQASFYVEYGLGASGDHPWKTSTLVCAGACNFGFPVDGLMPSTTYHYRLVYRAADGSHEGTDVQFTTSAATDSVPVVVTGEAPSRIGRTFAAIPGSVTSNGVATTYYVVASTAPGVNSYSPAVLGGTVTYADDNAHGVSVTLAGLRPATTYYYRLYAERTSGAPQALGAEHSFTTQAVGPATRVVASVAPGSRLADGQSTAIATAVVTDANGNRVSGDAVEFSSDDPDQKVSGATSQGNGVYTATITTSKTVGDTKITAKDISADPDVVSEPATLTQTVGPATSIAVGIDPASIPANGSSTSTVTATVTDAFGHALSNEDIHLSSDDSGQQVGGATPQGSGVYTATITSSTTAHTTAITVTDQTPDPDLVASAATLTQTAPVITLSPASLPHATAESTYSQTISADGGKAPYTFMVTAGSPPSGVTLSSDGTLSGTAPGAGTFNFTVTATDSGSGQFTGSKDYSLVVDPPTITLSPSSLSAATVGQSYSETISASGGKGPYSYLISDGAPPAGLALSEGGALTGTPTAGGSFTFTVIATDDGAFTGSREFTLAVAAPTISVTPTSLSGGKVAHDYSETLGASGGTAPRTFDVTAGSLPPGVLLSSAGSLSGTPTKEGTFNFTVTATDSSTGSGPYTGSRAYSVMVDPDAAPVAVKDSKSLSEDDPATTIDVLANDTDSDGGATTRVTNKTDGTGGSVAITSDGADLTYAPAKDFCGSDSFTYTLNGGSVGTVSVDVSCVNDAPVLSAAGTLAYTENDGARQVSDTLSIVEVDGNAFKGASASISSGYLSGQDSLPWTDDPSDGITRDASSTDQTLVLTGTGTRAQYQAALRAVRYTNGSDTPGTANRSVTFSATDSADTSDSDVATVTVTPVDDAPVAVNDSKALTEDDPATTIDVLANDTDVDGGTKNVASRENGAHGTVAITGGGVSYTPDADFCGSDSFTYTLNGGSVGTVSVTVACVDSPTAMAVSSSAQPSTHGQKVSLTATVTASASGAGTPVGQVTFKDGSTSLGTRSLGGDGKATLETGELTVGDHSITVEYAGTPDFNPSSGSLAGGQHVDEDSDRDGIADKRDTDDDGDGVLDPDDAFPLDASESKDSDGDGIGDNADPHDDRPANSEPDPDPEPGPGPSPEPPAPTGRTSLVISHLQVRRAGAYVKVRVLCHGPQGARCAGTLALDPAKGKRRLAKAAATSGRYGKAAFDVRTGTDRMVRVKATARLVKAFRTRRHVIAMATASFTGVDGVALTVKRRLTIS